MKYYLDSCIVIYIIEKVADYRDLLIELIPEDAEVIKLTTDFIDKATKIRSTYSFRTPDSIHLASALNAKADFFITNDKHLNAFKELEILSL